MSRSSRLIIAGLLCAAFTRSLDAATAVEVIAEVDRGITADQREEPGNTARAAALVAAMAAHQDLSPADQVELRFAAAGAWLEAGRISETRGLLLPLVQNLATPAAIRTRAGLMWVASWQLEWKAVDKPADFPAVAVSLARFGELGSIVEARAATAEAERLLAIDPTPTGVEPALGFYDKALALLAHEAPEQRVPVYALRVAAMERAEENGAAVHAWLQARASDPAAAQALETAMTAAEKQLGTRAPALRMPRVDGVAGHIDLADYAGKPVLIDFFATWCKPCERVAPLVVGLAKTLADQGVVTIGVSLEKPQTSKDLPAWIARFGINYPIIGQPGGEADAMIEPWHVDGIPRLILVGPDGILVANQLLAETPEKTKELIDAALKRLSPPKAKLVPAAVDPVP